jgi:hypothetical protein
MSWSEKELRIRQILKDDFIHYAERCLRIRAKAGQIKELSLNRAQLYLHERLEDQKRRTGKVRALILKGRQQGCSTYVGARFYHKVTHSRGYRVFILTHEDEATINLFNMANRYHEYCPDLIKPHTGASNARELEFDLLDSGYKVGTARTKAVGRSQTIQLFHGSEVAFWPHADTHVAGVLQAIPDLPDTEIILESTANGFGNFFSEKWQEAESGASEYEAIFIPWFWQEEYARKADPDLSLTDEEQEYCTAYKLTLDQMAWRRNKITELGDPLLFKQEYPATSAEAFQLTGHDSFIPADLVLKARKNIIEGNGVGPLVLGVDPARYGDDRFSIAWRTGRKIPKIESQHKIDVVTGANWVKTVIDRDKPARVFIDVGGVGAGVVDILRSWGEPYSTLVRAINFGGEPQECNKSGGPRNRRAEMWMRSKEWLADVMGVSIPDTDALQADACAPSYKYDMNSKLLLQSKEEMRSKGIRSPDEWDAVALTFAEPVAPKKEVQLRTKTIEISKNGTLANANWMGT